MHYSFGKSRQLGALTIEFSIGLFIFLVFVVSIMELSRYVLIVNTAENVFSDSIRQTRIFESERFDTTYKDRLKKLSDNNGKLWGFIIEPSKISISAKQYTSLSALSTNQPMVNCNNCPIVVYDMNYNYMPMISLGLMEGSVISRKLITVQEHEGWN